MSTPAPCLSILILTENAGAQGYPTVLALTRILLRLVDPLCDLARIRFEPLEDERLGHIVRANLWKSDNPLQRREIVALRRRIATKLLERERPGFVVFHVDGDRRWQDRDESENAEKFHRLMIRKVEQLLGEVPRSKLPAELRPHRIRRFFLLMPFYSVESWLFQNTDRAIEILQQQYGGSHVFQFEAWRRDRTLLDEVAQPKSDAISPLRDRHNQDLAERRFPGAEVAAAGKSFAQSLARLRDCPDLVQALALTHPDALCP